jgi:hypothetical protein
MHYEIIAMSARDPTASRWVLVWMLICLPVFMVIVPIVHYFKRRRDRRDLHDRIEKAKADILADGVVEGPKGPYVPHESWGVGTEVGTPRSGPPRGRSYHGGPWPKA